MENLAFTPSDVFLYFVCFTCEHLVHTGILPVLLPAFCLNKVALFSPVTKHIMGIFKCCFSIYLLSAKRITFSKSETYLIDYFLE